MYDVAELILYLLLELISRFYNVHKMFFPIRNVRILGQFVHNLCSVLVFLANVNSSSGSLYVIGRPSVCCLSSVTLVHPTQTIEIFGNVSTPCGTLAIHDLCVKILQRSSQGNPFVGG